MANRKMTASYDRDMTSRPGRLYYGGTDFWNFGYWPVGTETQAEASANLVNRLLEFMPDKRGRILDVACGLGASTRLLLNLYDASQVTAVNLSAGQIAVARGNAPGCNLLVMDGSHLAFPDASFDNVLCVESAFHFDTRDDFLREAFRVLKPGGWLAHSDILFRPSRVHNWASLRFPVANYLPDPAALQERLAGC